MRLMPDFEKIEDAFDVIQRELDGADLGYIDEMRDLTDVDLLAEKYRLLKIEGRILSARRGESVRLDQAASLHKSLSKP